MKISIQGELGSFSHQAALQFEPEAEILPCTLAADAFAHLQNGEADAVALPIENSLAGSVVEHYDLLVSESVHIERELILPISHCLIGIPGSVIGDIQRAYSHPVALAQCRRFFAEHPEIEAMPFYDTAGAVKQIVKLRERHSAAVAAELAAYMHAGEVLVSGIEDNAENYTRFLFIRPGRPLGWHGEPHKLSLSFELQHRVGALAAALHAVAAAGANLTKIQSRPIPGQPWSYIFAVDLLSPTSKVSDRIVADLAPLCTAVKVLGLYPPAELPTADLAR